MSSGMALPQAAARLWADPARRQEILDMHDAGVPLREMVRRVGLDDALEADGLGDLIDGLDDADVAAIRQVFVAEAARAGERRRELPDRLSRRCTGDPGPRHDDPGRGQRRDGSRPGRARLIV